ncbi:hypothetical protein CKY51_14975 [Xanthomonas maliensis]|nr:hypothetical protein CKY51_14975 [Xanthomonas maliensis]
MAQPARDRQPINARSLDARLRWATVHGSVVVDTARMRLPAGNAANGCRGHTIAIQRTLPWLPARIAAGGHRRVPVRCMRADNACARQSLQAQAA